MLYLNGHCLVSMYYNLILEGCIGKVAKYLTEKRNQISEKLTFCLEGFVCSKVRDIVCLSEKPCPFCAGDKLCVTLTIRLFVLVYIHFCDNMNKLILNIFCFELT